MKLIVMLLTEWKLEPRNVISAGRVVLFDVFEFAADEAQLLWPSLGFHDWAPSAV
jgi:hypothetical protein